MSDIIRLLPDSVANQIAAGEVIQRPASVIKELVENSVDAGATDIRIFIKDAGRTLIQVVDNGKGMSATDARMAFERHATSKISSAADLFTLHTMGFRGEALPSICAISQIEMRTKPEGAQIGTRLMINATKVETQESVACDKGTNIMVKNLFFNVPARRKFLKSDNVELSNIMREFERLALVNNSIRMSIDTGTRVIDLKPGSFHQRIEDIWKNSLDLHLIPIEVETSLIKISGYISRPEYARRRNPLQYLIVNGRNMRHPYFHKAIAGCYDSLIAPDTQPCYFLKFKVDPESIDVNIHPTKNEIKFEYEQEIWPILQAVVKSALGKFGAVPSIDFSIDPVPVAPKQGGETPKPPTLDIPGDYNPFSGTNYEGPRYPGTRTTEGFKTNRPGNPADMGRKVPSNWESLYSEFMRGSHGFGGLQSIKEDRKDSSEDGIIEEFKDSSVPVNICIQWGDRFIVSSTKDGILLIDQRRAHIKILYEEFLAHIKGGDHSSQGIMFPDTLEIDASQQDALEEIIPELYKIGFRIEYDSDNRWSITGIPSYATNLDSRDIVMRMIESIDDSTRNYGKEEKSTDALMSRIALVMARSGAINYGKRLTPEEMEHITTRLFSLPDPSYTPSGHKIFHLLDQTYLIGLFK
ncbi:MAG: DNA mismatch repair endonuclease MutL [Muribaculaceae bacterium]|nr:DNA mismatch repair endonuclease MutL [Muribaculaceae bacterium]